MIATNIRTGDDASNSIQVRKDARMICKGRFLVNADNLYRSSTGLFQFLNVCIN